MHAERDVGGLGGLDVARDVDGAVLQDVIAVAR